MLKRLRSFWRSFRLAKLEKRVEEADRRARELLKEEQGEIKGPVDYAKSVLGMEPFPYQAELLEDKSKRIVACMGRQTGKTTTIAMKAIYFADTNDNVTVLITSPSLRQSMIMFDRIAMFVYSSARLRNKIVRATRTLIHFENGSRIIALPCSENLLRGYTAQMVICLPAYAKVMLENGKEVPISELKTGQKVLTYNVRRKVVEPKRVKKVYCNPLVNRSLIRIFHELGYLDCTSDHKVFTLGKGWVEAKNLQYGDKILWSDGQKSLLKTSRVLRVQILDPEAACQVVYNIEIEDNHNYFAERVLVKNCDEASFMPEEVITQVIFPMLSTTDGYAIFLSTPWDKDHFFYKAFMNPAYSVHKVKSSDCPLIKPEFLEEMRQNMTREAFLMEYEAEFVEALNSYFPQELIRKCVELAQKLGVDLYASLEAAFPSGNYYAGVDFGKLQDYSVITVLKREGDILKLVYLYQFPLETPYSQVIGHLVRANQKLRFRKALVDQTGVGEPVLEEIRNQGLSNVEGLKFTVQTKEELLTSLKIAMEQDRLAIPYYRQLCQQINDQQYEYSKSGHLQFSHPANSHDDMLWSLALATYAAREPPRKEPAFTFD